MFSYSEMVTRNLGFVSEEEQQSLQKSCIFIPGVGGMGGTALECLARTGIGHFIIADIDVFEVSNLNRQIFSSCEVVGQQKALVAKETLLKINPQIQVEIFSADWQVHLEEILNRCDLVINGCDDVKATVHLMRKAREKNKTVIDAFASTLPSVYVVKPADPRPEEFLGFPTVGLDLSMITPEIQKQCSALETEYVLTHSSTVNHVILQYAAEMVSGKRKRISMAPMVWMTGLLMSYEAIKILLNKSKSAQFRGVFLNPWTMKYEKPICGPWAWIKRKLVRAFLKNL